MAEFVHLHVHSDFSLQDAAVSVRSLANRAIELGMTHVALTDHGNMFGVMEFLSACKEDEKHNPLPVTVNPIVGCEFYLANGSRFTRKYAEGEKWYSHLVLLAANREGYFNLVQLSSYAYTEGFYSKPRIDEELLEKYHGGLICLSACVSGEIPRLIQKGKTAEAEKLARHWRDLFGEGENGEPNFYLEIQDHGIPGSRLGGIGLSQKEINAEIAGIARRTGIPLVATNDVHYLDREDNVAHDVLLCVGGKHQRGDEKRKRYYGDQFYFKSAGEMAALFPEYPEAISNTVRIAERCKTDVPRVKVKDLPNYLPEFTIPEGFAGTAEYLRHIAAEGLAKRYPQEKIAAGEAWDAIEKRAEHELDTIIKMNFTGYFLIVADFINWAKDRGIDVGPGRGSGAGSIVAYSIRITDIDPLKYGLLFERFLNPERISMPDFDVDFCNERRKEVIQYVTDKYGRDNVGQIITFGTLGARQVIKDVGRVLGISIPDTEAVVKLIPEVPKMTLKKAFEENGAELKAMEADPKYTEMFALARKLEGLNRQSSLHAAGVVIGKTALINYVPLYRDSKTGGIATQYTMGYLENCGLVKMDFLGLKTLDLLHHATDLIRERGGEYADFSLETIDENDAKTFRMLQEGKSAGVFQFDEEGMQNTLRKCKPTSIDDLTAITSLYRPGPMQFIDRFAACKAGRQPIEYPAPSLEETLKETYGVIVYQEQVMMAARIIAGYSLGGADLLRRAMGKKKKEIIDKEKIPFIEGAVRQGYTEEKAGEIYDILVPFADYGFNKSHAAAYSVLSYRTAWLKVNFPAEFMAANLSNEIGGGDNKKLPQYIEEVRKMGLVLDPPSVNRSGKFFTVADDGNGDCRHIVYGLKAIKGIGDKPADEIIECRKSGPYKSLIDFLQRVDIKTVGKKVVELLIQVGAFDGLGQTRDVLQGNFEAAVEYVQNIKEDKKNGASLFGDSGEQEFPDFVFKEAEAKKRDEWLAIELELLGCYASGHPMDKYREAWRYYADLNLAAPGKAAKGSYTIVGIIKSLRVIKDKNGNEMAFGTLQDYRGEIDLVFFSRTWKDCKAAIVEEEFAALKGNLDPASDKNPEKPSFKVSSAQDIDKLQRTAARKAELGEEPPPKPSSAQADSAAETALEETPPTVEQIIRPGLPQELHITLREGAAAEAEALRPLHELLEEERGPCPVFIHIPVSGGEVVIRTAPRFSADGDIVSSGKIKSCGAVAQAMLM